MLGRNSLPCYKKRSRVGLTIYTCKPISNEIRKGVLPNVLLKDIKKTIQLGSDRIYPSIQ